MTLAEVRNNESLITINIAYLQRHTTNISLDDISILSRAFLYSHAISSIVDR